MPEYTYLLEKRLSDPQKNALQIVRDVARDAGLTVFLAGGAVRDLTTGSSVRDLDFTVQGNALELESPFAARGATVWGRVEPTRTLFLWFPGSVRVEVSSARSERFPKPGKPEYSWSGIIDDLFRRDFTANAMALSLNEGSYGLLLDPLNGVADIENRQLRLVSNYGFLEDPSRLIRAVRLQHRLEWQMEERTAVRFENAREADGFEHISPLLRGYEIEKIAAEEEAFGVMQALEAGGWLGKLFPEWNVGSVDTAALEALHRNRIQLLMQGIVADLTAVHLEVLTARMKPAALEQLKAALVRPGLREQWENLDADAKEFARRLTSREASSPSASWKLFHSAPAEPILWLAHTRKGAAVETRFKDLFTVWPEAAKKVPVALMLEMRITPDLAAYEELLHEMFLRQIDGQLETDEQMRAFLEPYSPPAPPPPVTVRRTRGKKAGKRKDTAHDERDDGEDDDETPVRARGEDDEEDEDVEHDENDHEERDSEPAPVSVKAPAPAAAKAAPAMPPADLPLKPPAAAKPPAKKSPVAAAEAKSPIAASAGIAAAKPTVTRHAEVIASVKPATGTRPVSKTATRPVPAKAAPPAPRSGKATPGKAASKAAGKKAPPPAKRAAAAPAKKKHVEPQHTKHAKQVKPASKKRAPAVKQASAVKKTVAPAKKGIVAKQAKKAGHTGHAVKVPVKKIPAKASKRPPAKAAKPAKKTGRR